MFLEIFVMVKKLKGILLNLKIDLLKKNPLTFDAPQLCCGVVHFFIEGVCQYRVFLRFRQFCNETQIEYVSQKKKNPFPG